MADTFEQKKQEDKPRDKVEASRVGASIDASQALKDSIQDDQNLNKLPKEEQTKARQVKGEINISIQRKDRVALANIMRVHKDLLNTLDPSIILNLNQELRTMAREENKEAAKNGNMPVLTAGAMDYIKQGSDIFGEIGNILETTLQKESKEKTNNIQVAQFQSRVEAFKAKLDDLYKKLSKLQTFDTNNVA